MLNLSFLIVDQQNGAKWYGRKERRATVVIHITLAASKAFWREQ